MTVMRLVRPLAAGLLGGVVLLGSGAASAAPAPSPSPTCTQTSSAICVTVQPAISVTVTTPGATVSVQSGSHQFDPGASVGVTAQSVVIFLGTVTADATGDAALTFAVPAALPDGTHHVVFSGLLNGQAHTVALPFTVVQSAAGLATGTSTGGLPFTGSSTLVPFTEAGLGLVVVGSAVLLLVRRRRGSAGTTGPGIAA